MLEPCAMRVASTVLRGERVKPLLPAPTIIASEVCSVTRISITWRRYEMTIILLRQKILRVQPVPP